MYIISQLLSTREARRSKKESKESTRWQGLNLLGLLYAQASMKAWELSLSKEDSTKSSQECPKHKNVELTRMKFVIGFLGFIPMTSFHTRVVTTCPKPPLSVLQP